MMSNQLTLFFMLYVKQGILRRSLMNSAPLLIKKQMNLQKKTQVGFFSIFFTFRSTSTSRYNPLRASSFIDLPEAIKRRNTIVNIRNDDDYCFAWSIVAAFNPLTGLEFETLSYPHPKSVLNLTGNDFSISLKDINKFENQNNISINVYGIET